MTKAVFAHLPRLADNLRLFLRQTPD
jgi:hypothetical protein